MSANPANLSAPAALPLKSWAGLGAFEAAVEQRLAEMRLRQFARRFWEKDTLLWTEDEGKGRAIRQCLGWLSVIEPMQQDANSLVAFARQMSQAGFTHALLLGMGGSSLCPEVCRRTLGVAPGFLDLAVLDSTDPAAVRKAQRRSPPERTLYLVSSKSGTTTEIVSFFHYFYEQVRQRKAERAGENFIAITDAGTPLVKWGVEKHFRRIFLNPSDIGGRFSALSYFGLVPAALLGADIGELLERASRFLPRGFPPGGFPQAAAEENAAIQLGAILGELGLRGRDKITFLISPPVAAFGLWVEQLVAESTGKEGKGLFPVHGEPPPEPGSCGPDRVFVHLRLRSSADTQWVRKLAALEKAGHPVIRLELADTLDLGAEFFRWEVATAVAGSLLRIDPFDQPNVQESKANTGRLLKQFEAKGKLPEPPPLVRQKGISLYGKGPGKEAKGAGGRNKGGSRRIPELLAAHCRKAKPGDYVAILAYLAPTPARDQLLGQLRLRLRDALGVATSAGYGPRYLHSTGQFHKGGPPRGVFLQITARDEEELPVPSLPYSFSLLKQAQALGDLEAIQARKRPILRLHLEQQPEAGLRQVLRWIEQGLAASLEAPKKPARKKRG